MFSKIMFGCGVAILLICAFFRWLKKQDAVREKAQEQEIMLRRLAGK